ncbi:UNVERIFIED_CONTAM: hypothetical protein NY603_42160, partial [Bacteroidetes bacterium 56_B9]
TAQHFQIVTAREHGSFKETGAPANPLISLSKLSGGQAGLQAPPGTISWLVESAAEDHFQGVQNERNTKCSRPQQSL